MFPIFTSNGGTCLLSCEINENSGKRKEKKKQHSFNCEFAMPKVSVNGLEKILVDHQDEDCDVDNEPDEKNVCSDVNLTKIIDQIKKQSKFHCSMHHGHG